MLLVRRCMDSKWHKEGRCPCMSLCVCVCYIRSFKLTWTEVLSWCAFGHGWRWLPQWRKWLSVCVHVCVRKRGAGGRHMGTSVMVKEQTNLHHGLVWWGLHVNILTVINDRIPLWILSRSIFLSASSTPSLWLSGQPYCCFSASVRRPFLSVCLSVQASAPLFRPNLSVCQCLVIGAV